MAGLEVIALLGDFFYSLIGNPLIITAIIFGVVLISLAMFRAPIGLILMILIPLAIGFVLNSATNNFIELPAWILIALFLCLGFMFFLFWFFFIR